MHKVQTVVQMNQKLQHMISDKLSPLAQPLDAMYDWLSQAVRWPTDTSLSHLQLRRLWPSHRRGISFELLVIVKIKNTQREVTLQGGWLSEPRLGRPHHNARLSGHALLGLRLHHESLDLWVCSPDRDKRIRWSRELFDHHELAELLSVINHHAVGSQPITFSPQSLQLSLRAYRVHRRCVMHVAPDHHDGVYVKAFHRLPPGYNTEPLSQLQQQLTRLSKDTIKIPDTLAIDQTKRLIVTSCVRGNAHPLQYNKTGVAQAAQVLACLHACDPVATNASHSTEDEMGTLTRWPNALSIINKALDQHLLSAVIEKLTSQANHHIPGPTVMVHRDFYHTQLLQHEQTVWLLDLDTLCTGEREVDLATFLAHLLLDSAQRKNDKHATHELTESFLSSYIQHSGVIQVSRLGFYLSCALARLGSIHAVRGQPTSTILKLWNMAHAIIDAGEQATCPSKMLRQVIHQD